MLLAEENLLVGKLIALCNGLDEVEDSKELENFVRRSLLAIQRAQGLKPLILEAEELKKSYLASCLICKAKCGRTEDFSINSILPEEIRNKKIEKYRQWMSLYEAHMSFQDIVYHLTSLSW